MAQPYDRMDAYLFPGEFVRFTSMFGKSQWIHIEADEPLGQIKVPFTNAIVSMARRASRGGANNPVPPSTFLDADPIPMTMLEPQREDRIYQVRPVVFAYDRTTGLLVNRNIIPPLLDLEWEYPVGSRRGGTDQVADITINGIPNLQRGGNHGRIPVNMIYTRDDPSEVWDLFIFFKSYPAFRVLNGTRGLVGGGAGLELSFDWYLTFQGRKYIFRRATSEEEQKLDNGEIPYRSIPSPGGVPPTLLRRE